MINNCYDKSLKMASIELSGEIEETSAQELLGGLDIKQFAINPEIQGGYESDDEVFTLNPAYLLNKSGGHPFLDSEYGTKDYIDIDDDEEDEDIRELFNWKNIKTKKKEIVGGEKEDGFIVSIENRENCENKTGGNDSFIVSVGNREIEELKKNKTSGNGFIVSVKDRKEN